MTNRPNFSLPDIYPITDRRLSGRSHAAQVERLVAAGARFIQLREKHAPAGEFFADARAALDIARRAGARIIINDRVDIARALDADGVHLGQDDLPPEAARAILGPDAIIGFSTHDVAQAVAARARPVDYIAIGPVFATRTKENPDATVGPDGVRAVRAALGDFPLVAIGGLTAARGAEVFAAGADSLAVVSGLVFPLERLAENFAAFARCRILR